MGGEEKSSAKPTASGGILIGQRHRLWRVSQRPGLKPGEEIENEGSWEP